MSAEPPEPSSPQPIVRAFMPELDTLRGVAILMVLFTHGFGFPSGTEHLHGFGKLFTLVATQGYRGVNLFFALSGFLITGILIDSRKRPTFYRRFYYRRVLRILPAYSAVLLLFVVCHGTSLIERHPSWAFLGLSAVYLANVTPLLGVPIGYGVLWSLAVEEQFYVFWPIVVRSSQRFLLGLAAALIVVAPVTRGYAFLHGLDYRAPYTWLVIDGLPLGALVAVAARSAAPRVRVSQLGAVLAAVALLLFVAGLRSPVLAAAFRLSAVNAFSSAVLCGALLVGTGPRKEWVRVGWLTFLGEISYGLYLYHVLVGDLGDTLMRRVWPTMPSADGNFPVMLVRFLVWSCVAVALATLSRRTFEEWFLRQKNRFG